jgi:hypothetical protein
MRAPPPEDDPTAAASAASGRARRFAGPSALDSGASCPAAWLVGGALALSGAGTAVCSGAEASDPGDALPLGPLGALAGRSPREQQKSTITEAQRTRMPDATARRRTSAAAAAAASSRRWPGRGGEEPDLMG